MSKVNIKQVYRILDANFNRAKEGLRVCEDICRYAWGDKALTRSFKGLRHGLTQAVEGLDVLIKALAARDASGDVGRLSTASEFKRANLDAVFWANSQRVKESMRVLEEISKLISPMAAQAIKTMRYKFYVLEQKALKRR